MKLKLIITAIIVSFSLFSCTNHTKSKIDRTIDLSEMIKTRPNIIETKTAKIYYKEKKGEHFIDCIIEKQNSQSIMIAQSLTLDQSGVVETKNTQILFGTIKK